MQDLIVIQCHSSAGALGAENRDEKAKTLIAIKQKPINTFFMT